MGLRENPTQRQRRLGQELQRLREPTGLSAAEAGARINVGRAHMSHIEAGRTHVSQEKVHGLARAYGCTRRDLVEELAAMAAASGRGWWTEYKRTLPAHLLDLAELESTAVGHRSFEWLYVPGLLQTGEYMDAVFRTSGARISSDLLERHREFRLRRQEVLRRDPPCSVHVVIHENVFHVGFVDRGVLARQLEHLVELARLPHVTIQLLPSDARGNPAAVGAFYILDARALELRTVYLEHPASSVFLTDHQQIEQYAAHFTRLAELALAPLDADGPPGEGSLGLARYLLYALKEGRRARL